MNTRKFKKEYTSSFQASVIADLKGSIKRETTEEPYSLPVTNNEAQLAELFAEALGVSSNTFVASLMEAELARMLKLKRKGATFSEMNEFYSSVVELKDAERNEINQLVANYLPIKLNELQNRALIDYSRKKLGLRFNNYVAFRLANFDGKPVIEMVFYIDQSKGRRYLQAWLGIKDAPIKTLTFTKVSSLNKYVTQVSVFANLFDLEFCHVGRRGLRYER